jgi:guanylate kinase
LLIVVSSPSGGGKRDADRSGFETVPGLSYSVSVYHARAATGRTERPGILFIDETAFEQMIARGDFLEWANVYGHLYGTSAAQAEHERENGRDIVLEIDVQGAEYSGVKCRTWFRFLSYRPRLTFA